jgi:hypothetical protein
MAIGVLTALILAASEAEEHDRLLGTVTAVNIGAIVGLAMLLRRRRARLSGRHRGTPPLGWGSVYVSYGGWWAFIVAITVLLLRVDSPRLIEIGGLLLFVTLALVTGALVAQERRAEEA